jgi:GNAT superfamily N-acetyltransferase
MSYRSRRVRRGVVLEPAARGTGVGAALIGAAETWRALRVVRSSRLTPKSRILPARLPIERLASLKPE